MRKGQKQRQKCTERERAEAAGREREKESKADKMKGGTKSSNEKQGAKTQIGDNQA